MMFIRELPLSILPPTNILMNQVGKPDINEVLLYAGKQVDKYLKDHAAHLPREQKEEVRQEALLRVANAYPNLDPSRGWKSFVQNHARGGVLDYLRDGTGFKETRWVDPVDEEEMDSVESEDADDELEADGEAGTSVRGQPIAARPKFKQRLNQRVSIVSTDDGRTLDVGEVAGIYGVHNAAEEASIWPVRWDLVARMAAVDPEIHLIAKILRGFSQTELAPGFKVTREMLSQRIRTFFRKLDDPEFYHSPWVAQTIYAFGLSERYHMDEKDQGIGWENEPVDLDSKDTLALMSLFQQLEFSF